MESCIHAPVADKTDNLAANHFYFTCSEWWPLFIFPTQYSKFFLNQQCKMLEQRSSCKGIFM